MVNDKINLKGFLIARNEEGNILLAQKNLITNAGVRCLTQGQGIKTHIKYISVGRGDTAATINDTKLNSEFARYPITEIKVGGGLAVINTIIRDNLTSTIKEWGLFINDGDKDCSTINTGILFSRVVSSLARLYKQKLMIEWRITLT